MEWQIRWEGNHPGTGLPLCRLETCCDRRRSKLASNAGCSVNRLDRAIGRTAIDLMATRIKLAQVNSTQFLLVLPLLSVTAGALIAQSDWAEPFPPHRIADNLYYVGSKGLATYLITTTNGHILINSSFERTLPIIRGGVENLGFRFADIKILLASHAHSDHVAGHALIKQLTGAR